MNLNDIIYELSSKQHEITLILIFLIIFIIIFAVLRKVNLFEENKAIRGILALIVSLISVWYLSQSQILTIIYSYNLLGFFITLLLPFAIIFIFLHKSKTAPALRKIVWGIFGIVFIYIWYNNPYILDETFFWIGLILILGAIFLDESIHKGFQ